MLDEMDAKNELTLDTLIQVNQSLKDSLTPAPANDRERDGSIQRFEYTVELSWRLIRKCLLLLGRSDVSASPKPLLRSAFTEGWIQDLEEWLAFIEARNLTSHSYKNVIANQVFESAVRFPPFVDRLIQSLKSVK